jgi:pyroglutamyl-peptidase
MQKILLTSFQTWLPHQKSNSSDDLLEAVARLASSSYSLTFLRHLPVDISQASDRVITQINESQPDIIICCGMAESRRQLSIESNATNGDKVLKTSINLDRLVQGCLGAEISHEAGKFVCEGLYYSVLHHLQKNDSQKHGLFVHVPVITPNNFAGIMADFELILQKLSKRIELNNILL